jgi:hypothetical protein
MSIPDSGPNEISIVTTALCLVLFAVSCNTLAPSNQPSSDVLLHAVRSSGGIVLESAYFKVELARLVYGHGREYCADLTPRDQEQVREWLKSAAWHAALNATLVRDSASVEIDAPHLTLEAAGMHATVQLFGDTNDPVLTALRPIDALFRRKFGRIYTYALMP